VACVVVADAVVGMYKKLCPDTLRRSIAVLTAAALLLVDAVWFQVLFVLIGAVVGALYCRETLTANTDQIKVNYGLRFGSLLLGLFVALLLLLPLLAPQTGLVAIFDAFYRAGAMVFGGGHVVIPFLESFTVSPGWISSEEFLAGYGATQAVPGPMFTFAAYLGALIPSGHEGWIGASVALLAIFLPGFLLLAAVLPMWQRVSANQLAINAIAGASAAVVGLLGAVLYDPIFTSSILTGYDMAVCVVAYALLAVWRLSPLWVVAWCVVVSVLPVVI